MSIERSGPEGYEYQYLVTTYLSLRKIEEKSIKILVEKVKGEDAEILYEDDGMPKKYEIQVKGTRSDIGIKELVSWLHHFPDRVGEENLLSRLIDNPQSICLFFTRGRCKDEIKSFVSKNSFSPHVISPLVQKSIEAYINELNNQYSTSGNEDTALKKKRKSYCLKQKRAFEKDKSMLKEVAKRIIVFELQEDELLKQSSFNVLNKKYLVPQGQTKVVLDKLIRLVIKARNEKSDISSEFKSLLEKYSAKQVFDSELNIVRPEIEELTQYLNENNILLLTGISFCGKTHIAKQIASKFQREGYSCLEEKDVSNAIRFLSESTIEERLCILEDPFGHINLEENIEELWLYLEDFSRKIKSHRKIIITSKKDLLTSYHGTQEIPECNLGDHGWYDLTFTNKSLSIDLWKGYASANNLNSDLIINVEKLILTEHEDHLLQPGQIRHLALMLEENRKNLSKDEMLELATIDAKKITRYYSQQNNDYKKLVAVLGLGANTIYSIAEKEVAHILSLVKDFPSVNFSEVDDFLSIESGSTETYPEYIEEYILDDTMTDILDDLVARGYISLIKDEIRFIHPTFLEASKLLYFNFNKRSEIRWVLELLKKALSSLNSNVALISAKQLKVFYYRFSSKPEIQKQLIDIAFKTMKSVFPSVRDETIVFLINISDDLSSDAQDKLFFRLNNKPAPETDLKWREGNPWISSKTGGYSLGDLGSAFLSMFPLDKETFTKYKNRVLKDTEEEISLEHIWKILISFNAYELSDEESLKLLLKMMFINESFIRGEAAYFLLKKFGYDQELVDLVMNDLHPYVKYQGTRGIFKGWNFYSCDTKIILIAKLNEALKKSSLTVAAHQFMIDLGDAYGNDNIAMYDMSDEDKKSIWNLWASIFPEFFKNLPHIRIKESDLYITIKEADKYVSELKMINIIQSWIDWIDSNLIKTTLSDYALGVADIILTSKVISKEKRVCFLNQLLNKLDTNFIGTSLATYIDHWKTLCSKEKEYILNVIKSERKDIQWLKAIALTRKYVPLEIQELLLEGLNFDNYSAEEILRSVPETLIHDCLRVYHGYIGSLSTNNSFWENINLSLLKKPEHHSFNLVIREWTYKMANGSYIDNDEQKNMEEWRLICSHEKEEVRETAFSYLLQWSSKIVGVNGRNLWIIFFEENYDKLNEYIERIVGSIAPIEDRNKSLGKVFGDKDFFGKILPKINPDYAIMGGILAIEKLELGKNDTYDLIHLLIKEYYKIKLPKLLATNNFVENTFKNLGLEIDEEIRELIDQSLKEIQISEDSQYKKYKDHYELENWLTKRKM